MNTTLPPARPIVQEHFIAVYSLALKECVQSFPGEYAWPVENVPIVAAKMAEAMDRNTFNHTSRAYRLACKRLGIAHTRKAILAFWKGEQQ